MLNTLINSFKARVMAEPTTTANGINVSIDSTVISDAIGTYWGWAEHRMNAIVVPDLILPSDTTMYMK